MVVKYIKVAVTTLTLIVVGIVTTLNIKAEAPSETWLINEWLDYNDYLYVYIPFYSNNQYFHYILIEEDPDVSNGVLMFYDDSTVFHADRSGWVNDAYRTVTFETAPTGDILTWLEANAVKQTGSGGYTQEDLDNAWADGYDAGISIVHENGFAGIYNPFTGQFYNNENSFSYIHGHYVGYNEAVDGFDYESYYSLGIKMAYMNGFGGYINPLTNEYYDITNSFSYIKGFNEALAEDYTFTGLLFQVFDGIGSVLSIELLPNITLGAIVAVPIVFGILYFILGKRKGD